MEPDAPEVPLVEKLTRQWAQAGRVLNNAQVAALVPPLTGDVAGARLFLARAALESTMFSDVDVFKFISVFESVRYPLDPMVAKGLVQASTRPVFVPVWQRVLYVLSMGADGRSPAQMDWQVLTDEALLQKLISYVLDRPQVPQADVLLAQLLCVRSEVLGHDLLRAPDLPLVARACTTLWQPRVIRAVFTYTPLLWADALHPLADWLDRYGHPESVAAVTHWRRTNPPASAQTRAQRNEISNLVAERASPLGWSEAEHQAFALAWAARRAGRPCDPQTTTALRRRIYQADPGADRFGIQEIARLIADSPEVIEGAQQGLFQEELRAAIWERIQGGQLQLTPEQRAQLLDSDAYVLLVAALPASLIPWARQLKERLGPAAEAPCAEQRHLLGLTPDPPTLRALATLYDCCSPSQAVMLARDLPEDTARWEPFFPALIAALSRADPVKKIRILEGIPLAPGLALWLAQQEDLVPALLSRLTEVGAREHLPLLYRLVDGPHARLAKATITAIDQRSPPDPNLPTGALALGAGQEGQLQLATSVAAPAIAPVVDAAPVVTLPPGPRPVPLEVWVGLTLLGRQQFQLFLGSFFLAGISLMMFLVSDGMGWRVFSLTLMWGFGPLTLLALRLRWVGQQIRLLRTALASNAEVQVRQRQQRYVTIPTWLLRFRGEDGLIHTVNKDISAQQKLPADGIVTVLYRCDTTGKVIEVVPIDHTATYIHYVSGLGWQLKKGHKFLMFFALFIEMPALIGLIVLAQLVLLNYFG